MAFVTFRAGDRFGQRSSSNVPKTFTKATYNADATTVPKAGDLVKLSTAFNNGVLRCAASDVPYGLVESVNSQDTLSTGGTLSIWILAACRQLVFAYPAASAPTRGQQIQMNDPTIAPPVLIGGFARDTAKGVASPNGVGIIVAVDEPGTGLFVVEFHGGTVGAAS